MFLPEYNSPRYDVIVMLLTPVMIQDVIMWMTENISDSLTFVPGGGGGGGGTHIMYILAIYGYAALTPLFKTWFPLEL